MKLQIWGSGAGEGVPALFCRCDTCRRARELGGKELRTRSCSLIDDRVMLDFSPDMFYNAYRYGRDLQDLSAVVFTHSHIDHLDSAELCMKAPDYCDLPEGRLLPLYGNSTCIAEIQRQLRFDLGRVPDIFAFHTLQPFAPVEIGPLRLTPLPATHAPQEQAFLLLLEQAGVRYLHCLDSAMPPAETLDFLAGTRLDGITMDCTYGSSREQSESHMGLSANVQLKQRLLAQGSADANTKFLLSHIAHHARLPHEELAALAAQEGLLTAYDGFTLELGEN